MSDAIAGVTEKSALYASARVSGVCHQILRYVWRPPSFMRGRKNELAALAAFILTVDRIEGCNKL
jgi:hypothetical protein